MCRSSNITAENTGFREIIAPGEIPVLSGKVSSCS